MDGKRAGAGGVSAAIGDGGVSERVVEGAFWGAEISGARIAESAIGAAVGDVGVQREAVGAVVVESCVGERAGGGVGRSKGGKGPQNELKTAVWGLTGEARTFRPRPRLKSARTLLSCAALRWVRRRGFFHSP